jgi:hypothetical protein
MTASKIEGPDPGCNYQYASKFTATHCAASCAAGEFIVCESNAECGDAGTCNPAKIKGNQVGTCGTL